MSTALTRNSWFFILRGILAIGLGILAFVSPAPTLAALIVVFAVYAIFDGVLAIVGGFSMPGGPNWWSSSAASPPSRWDLHILPAGRHCGGARPAGRRLRDRDRRRPIVAAATAGNLVAHPWLLALSGVVGVAFGPLLIMSPGAGDPERALADRLLRDLRRRDGHRDGLQPARRQRHREVGRGGAPLPPRDLGIPPGKAVHPHVVH